MPFSPPSLALAGLLALLGACASVPRVQAPEVTGASVRVVDVRLPDVRFAVDLLLRNRNDRELAVDALDATLALGGLDVGRASLARPVTLPALGESRVPLEVRGDAGAALAQLGASLGSGRALEYEVRGTLRLADGSVLPFRRRGTVPEARRP